MLFSRGLKVTFIKDSSFTSCRLTESDIGYVTIGVLQGSVLGKLLFLLYINVICNSVSGNKIKLFADDTN